MSTLVPSAGSGNSSSPVTCSSQGLPYTRTAYAAPALGCPAARHTLENALDRQPRETTVGEIVDLLSACDRNAPARLAINPFFPMAHRLGGVTEAADEDGNTIVYIAESKEAEQFGYLPPAVAVALSWQPPTDAPSRRRRRASGPDDAQ